MRGQAPRCRWLLTTATLLGGALLASGFRVPSPLSLQPLAARASKPGSCWQRPCFSAGPTRGSAAFGGVRRCAVASLLASSGSTGTSGHASDYEGIPAPGDAELADAARAMNDGRLHEARRCVAFLNPHASTCPLQARWYQGGIHGRGTLHIPQARSPPPPKRRSDVLREQGISAGRGAPPQAGGGSEEGVRNGRGDGPVRDGGHDRGARRAGPGCRPPRATTGTAPRPPTILEPHHP